jgi:hypothetical protein
MPSIFVSLIFLTGVFPFWKAWMANQLTTLRPAICWAFTGWLVWGWIVWTDIIQGEPSSELRYLATSLTGCAAVAVLGARRPGVMAWNFVVAGLLVVMLFLLMESRLAEDDLILNRLKIICLASSVALGILNYLPTRMGPAAILLALSSAFQIGLLIGSESLTARLRPAEPISWLTLALIPWTAYAGIRWRAKPPSEFDHQWLSFRDRFGLVWGQRLREQFNESAKHAGWPVVLRWQGLRILRGAPTHTLPELGIAPQEMMGNLQALMKRFKRKGDEAVSGE